MGKSAGGAGSGSVRMTTGPDSVWPLLEAVRPALARTITEQVAVEGMADVIELGSEVEQSLLEQVERTGLALPPEQARQWAEALAWLSDRFSCAQRPAVILCHPNARPAIARQIVEGGANLRAITAAELLPLTQLRCKHIVKVLQQQPMMSPQIPEE